MVREERTIEVTVISATDLKKVKKFGREQKNYVSAYIYPSRRQITGADPYGGINPIWNTTLKLTCYETDLFPATDDPATSSSSAHKMTLEIYSHSGAISRGIFHAGDKLVGTVTIPLQQVASAAKAEGPMPPFDVHLPTESGEVHGSLNLSVKLGAKRELGQYEDITAAPISSHPDQVATPSIYPPSMGQIPSTQPSSYKSQGQTSYGKYPPANEHKPSAQHQNSAVAAAEEDLVTGYPAPGYYAFAPLGQLPVGSQGTSTAHGSYVVHSPNERAHHQTRRERKRERRQTIREWRHRRREEKQEEGTSEGNEQRKKRSVAIGRRAGVIQLGLAALHILTGATL